MKASGEDPPPNYKTVQTLLRIMEEKGQVDHKHAPNPGSGGFCQPLALQHCQPLPESEILQDEASMRSKAANEQAKS